MRPHLLIGLGLLMVACGAPATSAVASPSPSVAAASTPSPAPSPRPVTLSVAGSRYGQIIVDGSGRTLYLFDAEGSAVPKCYGPCATAWPPLLTTTPPVAGPDLSQALIATVKRTDGSTQVAYNGHLLYYYVGDRSAGDIKCQAAVEYGGGWYVVDAHGNKISTP
jgi:predicted lipoprotein with Yx(FWY)xxD motif